MAKNAGKMQNLINYRMKATLNDGRQMAGQMMAFDRHMNLVFADTEEFRFVRRRNKTTGATTLTEEKRNLGLTIIRGAFVVAIQVDGPPPADPSARLGAAAPSGSGAAAT
ncbi:hypothetical protein BDY21DRAFT_308153, partial [Lineolata rhizophorae]